MSCRKGWQKVVECPLCLTYPTTVPLLSPTCHLYLSMLGLGEEPSGISPHIHPPVKISQRSKPSKLLLADTPGSNIRKGSREPTCKGDTMRSTLSKYHPSELSVPQSTSFPPLLFLSIPWHSLPCSTLLHSYLFGSLSVSHPTLAPWAQGLLPLLFTNMSQMHRTCPGTW